MVASQNNRALSVRLVLCDCAVCSCMQLLVWTMVLSVLESNSESHITPVNILCIAIAACGVTNSDQVGIVTVKVTIFSR